MIVKKSAQEVCYEEILRGKKIKDNDVLKEISSIKISNSLNQIKFFFTDGTYAIRPKNKEIELESDTNSFNKKSTFSKVKEFFRIKK